MSFAEHLSPESPELEPALEPEPQNAAAELGVQCVDGNEVRLLRNGEQAYPAMLSAIDAAREQILLEMYWFASDSIGRKFAAALARAAERGVEVSIIYDAIGSVGASEAMFDGLRRAGARVIEFQPDRALEAALSAVQADAP